MNDWGFLNYFAFWGVPLLLIVYLALTRIERTIVSLHRQIGAAGARAAKRIWLPLVLTALVVFSLTRPYFGKQSITVEGRGREIFLVIDVSLSMLAKDVSPSRLEFAKRKAIDIIRYIDTHSPEDKIGIVLFSGDAYVFCPLTPDHMVVTEFIQNVSPDLITSRGSSLLGALQTSAKALEDSHAHAGYLIILSDGEDLRSDSENLKEQIDKMPMPKLMLGIGTLEGAPIPLDEGGFLSSRGEIVNTKLNEAALKELFGDDYRRAGLLDSDFAPFLAPNGALLQTGEITRREITSYGELGPYILICALLLLLLLSVRGELRAILLLALALVPAQSIAEDNPFNDSAAYAAHEYYQRGEYERAYELYGQSREQRPDDNRTLQGLGSSAFKLGKLAEAEKAFSEFEQKAKGVDQSFDASYNLGNTYLAAQKYQQAIDAYNRALKAKENEVRALNNRAIAEALLKQQQQQKQEQKQDQEQQQQQKDQQESEKKEQQQEEQQQQERQKEEEKKQQQGEEQKDQGKEEEDDEKKRESSQGENDKPQEPDNQQQKQMAEEMKGEPMGEKEAKEWLKGLPESPLLLQRLNKREYRSPNEQIW